jgi:hypothetical protein
MICLYDDGGRRAAGFKGRAGDCVVRALAIATRTDYRKVYDYCHNRMKHTESQSALTPDLLARMTEEQRSRRKRQKSYHASPRTGVPETVYGPWLKDRGFKYQKIRGSKTLRELPLPGRICVARVKRSKSGRSSHLVAIVDGVAYDTWNPIDRFVEAIFYRD